MWCEWKLCVRQRQRSVVTLLFCVCLFVVAPESVVWAEDHFEGCGGASVAAQNAAHEAEVVMLVNEQRATLNLPPMKFDPVLTAIARYHAADMAADNYFSHNSQDRVDGALVDVCSWGDRVRNVYPGASAIAENIAWGYRTPASVMADWMQSPGHRSRILGNYQAIGVGYYQSRWVQDFGTRHSDLALIINREVIQTDSATITLYVHGSGTQIRLRNDGGPWSAWQPFQNELTWVLTDRAGERRVDAEVQRGSETLFGSDTILLTNGATVTPQSTTTPAVTPTATPTTLPSTTPLSTPATPPTATSSTVTPTATSISTLTATATAPTVIATPTLIPTSVPTTASGPPQHHHEHVYLPVVSR